MPAPERREPAFAVRFFDEEFRRRLAAGPQGLNPCEALALPYLCGSVLELGCGLGNLAIEAAKRGCDVTAVDASRVAVRRLRSESRRIGLRLRVVAADVEDFRIEERYDTVVCISLLMFLERASARRVLSDLCEAVVPGGTIVVSVLAEGTTYMDMFDPGRFCLFGRGELPDAFGGWTILENLVEEGTAPHATKKVRSTVVARRPRG